MSICARFTLAVIATFVLTAKSVAFSEGHSKIIQDKPHILRYFYNCRGRTPEVNVVAERGFVRVEPSTRFICGKIDHPVAQIIYVSATSYSGADVVRYYQGHKLSQVDFLEIGNERTVPLLKTPNQLQVRNSEEKEIYSFWNCKSVPPPPSIVANKGYAAIREGQANVCGNPLFPVKRVFYRAPSGFVGNDQVVIRSAFDAPYIDNISVVPDVPQPSDPPVANTAKMPPEISAELDALMRTQYSECWNIENLEVSKTYIPKIRIEFSRDGSLSGDPILLNIPENIIDEKLADSAMRAVHRCNPLEIPNKFEQYYNIWHVSTVRFNPKK